ncbi:uncharacterized protein LOC132541282 isoform X1 [Erinaceus europaeus]|uniref:Uncharacterized protein LOC132541282 isoform X1 n=1 Tax=Erinaceus europaeus TaxID=9365 RepID=A0ABM3Y7H6_ERIEU|nr:uncharacterized protein LOC132541282 isoform X1 [Erinaceus europaeus]
MEVTVPGSDVMSVSGLLKTATRLGDFFHKDPGGPGPGFHQHPRSAGCSLPMPASDISDFPTFEEARGTRQPSKLLPRVSLLGEEVRSSQWCLCSTDRRRGSPHVDGGLPVEAYSQHATQRFVAELADGVNRSDFTTVNWPQKELTHLKNSGPKQQDSPASPGAAGLGAESSVQGKGCKLEGWDLAPLLRVLSIGYCHGHCALSWHSCVKGVKPQDSG